KARMSRSHTALPETPQASAKDHLTKSMPKRMTSFLTVVASYSSDSLLTLPAQGLEDPHQLPKSKLN
ncbi:hypothetical protein HDU80_003026, partial [Chytriomyces hyalinus]